MPRSYSDTTECLPIFDQLKPQSMISQKAFLQQVLPIMKMHGKEYKKYKHVFAKMAVGGEVIQTITNDGLETSNTANAGDFIVKNQTDAGEMYILTPTKFNARYAFLKNAENGFAEYSPTGKIIGLEMTSDLMVSQSWPSEFHFEAPWGEAMVVKVNDFLASPPSQDEVYRIARQEFFETYKLANRH